MTIEEKASKIMEKVNSENPLYEIELFYNIECLPYARPRKGKYGSFYNPRDKYKKLLKSLFSQDLTDPSYPITGEIELEMTFGLRPTEIVKKSKLKQFLARIGFLRPIVRPDIDNYMKPILDALNGVLYKDDGQVVVLKGIKLISENEPFLNIKATYRETPIKFR